MKTLQQCPYCYAFFESSSRGELECDDCFRRFRLVPLKPGTRISCQGRSFHLAEVRNGRVIPPRHGFAHESFRHPDLAMLRKKYGLAAILRGGRDEFHQQLALKDWVCAAWLAGLPSVPSKDPSGSPDMHVDTMLTKSRTQGYAYFCTYKAIATVELASAFGWTARLINNMGHMIYEIWSNQLNKWFLCDSLYNIHYEKGGVPLSARELREEYYRNGGKDVRYCWGARSRDLGPAFCDGFRWYVVYMHNNFFDFPPGDHIVPVMMPLDKHNRGRFWRQGKQEQVGRGHKYVCKGIVAEESDPLQLDLPINQTQIFLLTAPDGLRARFHHNMPNFDHLAVRVDNGPWRKFKIQQKAEVEWTPARSRGCLQARCVNTRGVCGPESRIEIVRG